MNITKVLIEFVITFLVIYVIYYFLVIKKCKNKKVVPSEVNLILSFYKIDLKKIDSYQMVKVVSLVTTMVLSVIITLISVFFDNTIIILVFGTLLSILVAIICYRIIGRYYEKQSMKKEKK